MKREGEMKRERNEDYVRKIGFQFPPGFKTQYCLF